MSLPLSLGLYRLALGLLEPLAPALLARRAARGKEDPARIGERLGRASRPRPPGTLVWLHGASVGETTSLLPLIERLRSERPDLGVLVTSGTRTSADLLAKRLPKGVAHQYLPVDGPRAVARFLDHWRPDLAIIAESELWPNLISAAKARGVRMALISARITKASAKGWTRAPAAARALLSAFDLILPQDADSAARIAALGGRTGAMLNLKYAGESLACHEAELARLKSRIGARQVVLAASTHDGEDGLIVSAVSRLALPGAQPLLIIAPRHPARTDAILADLAGVKTARRSSGQAIEADTQVYVADTLGEMGLFYRLADVAIVGGSLVDGVGGHNPLEPARLGIPIITGDHHFNFADVYAQMLAGETAALSAASEDELSAKLCLLLSDPARAQALGAAARAFAGEQARATNAAMASLLALAPGR